MDKPDRRTAQKGTGFPGSPDIGFYFDPKWATTILSSPGARLPFVRATKAKGVIIFPWEDWGVPENAAILRRALRWLLQQVGDGKVVEVGCMGGHGRTGTALACLLILQGLNAKRALRRVWDEYCQEAIESQKQIDFIKAFVRKRNRRAKLEH